MKACSMRGEAGQPGLQMAAERIISVHLLYAEELMATSRREHARAEAEALEAQKVLLAFLLFVFRTTLGHKDIFFFHNHRIRLTPSASLHMLFVSTVEDCIMYHLAPTAPLRHHHNLLYIMFSSLKVSAVACTAFHACAALGLHPACCAG